VNGNSNNFNFNEEIIQGREEQEYKHKIKELKNHKYRQLIRMKYSEYLKKKQTSHKNRTVQDACSICLEKYKPSDLVLEFNCEEHFFHKDCLKEWIKKSDYCPLCMFDLLGEYRDNEEEYEEDDDI
jgi:hypothetical protein